MPNFSRDGHGVGERLARISTEMVRLHAKFYGKGPTRAKTRLVDNMVVCMLGDGLTTVERTMIDVGQHDSIHRMRRDFQRAMETEFRDVVERATGREVTAYVSMVNVDPDLTVELFFLSPSPTEEPEALADGAQSDGGPPADG